MAWRSTPGVGLDENALTRFAFLVWNRRGTASLSSFSPKAPRNRRNVTRFGRVAPDNDEPERKAFACPRCGAVSHHPTDVAEGYCGRCHDWTGLDGWPGPPMPAP
jgi:ribosomal protein S27AE